MGPAQRAIVPRVGCLWLVGPPPPPPPNNLSAGFLKYYFLRPPAGPWGCPISTRKHPPFCVFSHRNPPGFINGYHLVLNSSKCGLVTFPGPPQGSSDKSEAPPEDVSKARP
jgi:hypothetical protein